ncbi:protein of unknown function [Pseudomonas mediterranea]
MAVGQSPYCNLMRRHREQARSHRDLCRYNPLLAHAKRPV